jgi:hypothetical protein
MPDIFDFIETSKDKESKQSIAQKKEIVRDFARIIADAISNMEPPKVEVKNSLPAASKPVSYHFVINRNNRGFIESIDAEVKA